MLKWWQMDAQNMQNTHLSESFEKQKEGWLVFSARIWLVVMCMIEYKNFNRNRIL